MTVITVEKGSDKAAQSKAEVERWVSARFAQHTIIVDVDGKSEAVKFENYALTLDLTNKRDAQLSKALRGSNRFNRDMFVVGEVSGESSLGTKTEMLKALRDMNIKQLRAFLTLDEMVEYRGRVSTRDPNDLIPAILEHKQLK